MFDDTRSEEPKAFNQSPADLENKTAETIELHPEDDYKASSDYSCSESNSESKSNKEEIEETGEVQKKTNKDNQGSKEGVLQVHHQPKKAPGKDKLNCEYQEDLLSRVKTQQYKSYTFWQYKPLDQYSSSLIGVACNLTLAGCIRPPNFGENGQQEKSNKASKQSQEKVVLQQPQQSKTKEKRPSNIVASHVSNHCPHPGMTYRQGPDIPVQMMQFEGRDAQFYAPPQFNQRTQHWNVDARSTHINPSGYFGCPPEPWVGDYRSNRRHA